MLSSADVLRKTPRCEVSIASMAADLHGAHDGVQGTVVMESGRRKWGKAEGGDGGKWKAETGGKDKYHRAANPFSLRHKNLI